MKTVGDEVTAAIVMKYIDDHATKGIEPAQQEQFPIKQSKTKRR